MMGNGYMMENLSAEDQQKMLDQMNVFFTSTREVREQRYQKQLELNKEYAKPERDQAKIDTLQKELFDLSVQFEKERFNHMTATGATCRILLITGLYFGISRVNRSLTGRMADPIKRMKVLLLLTIFALSVVNIFLKRYLG